MIIAIVQILYRAFITINLSFYLKTFEIIYLQVLLSFFHKRVEFVFALTWVSFGIYNALQITAL